MKLRDGIFEASEGVCEGIVEENAERSQGCGQRNLPRHERLETVGGSLVAALLLFGVVLPLGVLQVDGNIERDVDQGCHQLHRGQRRGVTKRSHLQSRATLLGRHTNITRLAFGQILNLKITSYRLVKLGQV